MVATPMQLLAMLLGAIDAPDDTPDDNPAPACEPGEAEACEAERSGALHAVFADLEQRAATARYDNGAIKRTRYPRVDLRRRRVVIVCHQTGVERSSASDRWHLVTAHRVVKPDGTVCRLHPLDVRLVAANRLDRAPWHAISIEVGGNFEGIDGSGRWASPQTMGRGRASDLQIVAARAAVVEIVKSVASMGASVEAVLAHRVSGRNRNGVPNRQICCGSRIYSEVVEWSGAELGLAVAGPTFKAGGLTIPEQWHGRFWPRCGRRIAA